MAEALSVLTGLVFIIIVGILVSLFAKKIHISNVLLLLIAGLVIGNISHAYGFIEISGIAIVTIAIIALVIIVFDGASRFELKSLDHFSVKSLKLIGLFLLFSLITLPLFVNLLFFDGFNLSNFFYALIFSAIAISTDPATVFVTLKNKANKVVELLKVEALLNTPIVVLIPFLLLDIINQIGGDVILEWEVYLAGFMNQIVIGIGSGILVGIIFFKGMRKFYSEEISPLAIVGAALLAYVLAENLGGNGVLSVAVLGFMFGNMYLSHKENLLEFSGMISNSLEILVFMMLGFIVIMDDITVLFVVKAIAVFIVVLVARFIAARITLPKDEFSKKNIWFITLNMPKGIAVAVLVFSLTILGVPQLEIIGKVLVIIMILSILLSTIISKMYKKFIDEEESGEKTPPKEPAKEPVDLREGDAKLPHVQQ